VDLRRPDKIKLGPLDKTSVPETYMFSALPKLNRHLPWLRPLYSDSAGSRIVNFLDQLPAGGIFDAMARHSVLLSSILGLVLPMSAVPLRGQQLVTLDTGPRVGEAELDLLRKDIRDQKKQIVAANLPLTGDEAAKFWPVYGDYTAETIKINDARYALIKAYAANYTGMTDAQASEFIKGWLATDTDASKLRTKYVPIFEKILPPKKTAMFFQIDRRLGMMIELQLASMLPLLQP
jgi:hypothetical protein